MSIVRGLEPMAAWQARECIKRRTHTLLQRRLSADNMLEHDLEPPDL